MWNWWKDPWTGHVNNLQKMTSCRQMYLTVTCRYKGQTTQSMGFMPSH